MTTGRAVAAPVGALRLWLMAARPRTLPAAIAPVLVGTALAGSEHVFRPLAFVCALIGSVFIQIGTNLSNDYSDARRGADTEDRLGPVRVTAGGLVPPKQVLIATYVAFGRCNPAMQDAAADLGARPWRKLVTITLPTARSGIVAGFIFAFISMLGDYATPQLIGGTNGTTLAARSSTSASTTMRPSLRRRLARTCCRIEINQARQLVPEANR